MVYGLRIMSSHATEEIVAQVVESFAARNHGGIERCVDGLQNVGLGEVMGELRSLNLD